MIMNFSVYSSDLSVSTIINLIIHILILVSVMVVISALFFSVLSSSQFLMCG